VTTDIYIERFEMYGIVGFNIPHDNDTL